MSKPDAIQEFKRLFLEKTGNPWEAWEDKSNFQKRPGRFFPLDIVLLICYFSLLGFSKYESSLLGLIFIIILLIAELIL